jgi:phosphohistidine phosphatase
MKTLYLVRHAKAVNRSVGLADFDRALVPRGEADARNLAVKLKGEGVVVDLMISSPANRTLLTAHIFAKGIGYPPQKIMLKNEIYTASGVRALLRVVREIDDAYSSAMLFGHNPAFEALSRYLASDFDKVIPTCGVVAIGFQKEFWRNVAKGTGSLKFFSLPLHKFSKSTFAKSVAENLAQKLHQQTRDTLQSIDAETAEQFLKSFEDFHKKLARRFVKALKAYRYEGKNS